MTIRLNLFNGDHLRVKVLKGSVSRDFRPPVFFMIRTYLGHWWTGLSIFEFCFDFVEIFDHKVVSAVCNIPRRSSLYTPQRRSQRYATHRGDDLSGVQHTAEINCTPRNQNRNLHLSMVAFKETIRRNPFRGEHIYHEKKDLKYKMLIFFLLISEVCCTPRRSLCDRISLRNPNRIRK